MGLDILNVARQKSGVRDDDSILLPDHDSRYGALKILHSHDPALATCPTNCTRTPLYISALTRYKSRPILIVSILNEKKHKKQAKEKEGEREREQCALTLS